MKRILITTVISFSSLAYADNGLYTSIKTGISDIHFNDYQNKITPNNSVNNIEFFYKNSKETIYPLGSVAIGYDFSTIGPVHIRTELEYTYKDKANFNPQINKIKVGSASTVGTSVQGPFENEIRNQSLMLNAYYDLKNASKFTPYLSGGVGITRVKFTQKSNPNDLIVQGLSQSKTNNNFTWSAGIGLVYEVTKNVDLDLGYRYIDVKSIELEQTYIEAKINASAKLKSHDYSLGIRYNF